MNNFITKASEALQRVELLLPYNLTFKAELHSLKFDGQAGIVFFMLIPALIVGLWKPRAPNHSSQSIPAATVCAPPFIVRTTRR